MPRNRNRIHCDEHEVAMATPTHWQAKQARFQTGSVNFAELTLKSSSLSTATRKSIWSWIYYFHSVNRQTGKLADEWLFARLIQNIPAGRVYLKNILTILIRISPRQFDGASGNSWLRTEQQSVPLYRHIRRTTNESIDIISFCLWQNGAQHSKRVAYYFLLFFLLCVNISRKHKIRIIKWRASSYRCLVRYVRICCLFVVVLMIWLICHRWSESKRWKFWWTSVCSAVGVCVFCVGSFSVLMRDYATETECECVCIAS